MSISPDWSPVPVFVDCRLLNPASTVRTGRQVVSIIVFKKCCVQEKNLRKRILVELKIKGYKEPKI